MNKKILIGIPVNNIKEISLEDRLEISKKNFIVNDSHSVSFSLSLGQPGVKGRPPQPNSLEEPKADS